MFMILAALISFLSFALLMTHFGPHVMRRICGYAMFVDFALHGTIIFMFFGTSTLGLLQAEAAGIMCSLGLRSYRWLFGYEKLSVKGWVRYAGVMTPPAPKAAPAKRSNSEFRAKKRAHR